MELMKYGKQHTQMYNTTNDTNNNIGYPTLTQISGKIQSSALSQES